MDIFRGKITLNFLCFYSFIMLYKTIAFLLLIMPFIAMAQTSSSQWSLFLNETKLALASTDSVASVQLPKKSKGNLQMHFEKRNIHFDRTVLLMNEKRQTFLQNELKTKNNTASFLMIDVLQKSKEQPFTIYIVDVPADKSKAIGIRIMPVAICKIVWQ